MTIIQAIYHGRGSAKIYDKPDTCICQRAKSHILCQNCGYLMYGRVRYQCPKHPMVIFLIDITICPKCRSYEFLLQPVDVQRTL